jgi:MFS family permease
VSQPPNQPPPFPTPYEPPGFVDYRNAPAPPELLALGRRASVVMFILGGLALLCGALFFAATSRLPDVAQLESAGMKLPDTTGTPYTPAQVLHAMFLVVAVGMALVGAAYIVLGLLVRRGGRIAAMLGIGLTGLAVGWVLLNGISVFFVGGNIATGICGIAFAGVMVPVLITLIKWLAQSLPAARQLAAYRQHWALQQMYLYHQQQLQQPLGPAAAPANPSAMPDYALPPQNPPPPPPAKPE